MPTTGWNFDPKQRKFVSKAEALALGLRPPPPETAAAPPPPPPAARATDNVIPIPFGRTVTLGDALDAIDLKKAAPAPAPAPDPDMDPADDDDELEATPPADPQQQTPPPPAGGATSLPPEDEDPDSFAQLAGKVATQVGITVLEGIHRRRGVEPNELDDSDREQLEVETTKAVRRGLGDRAIPWWAPVVSAWGMAYFSMGNGAKRTAPPDQLAPAPPPAATEAPPPASSPPPPAPPPPRPSRPPSMKPPPVIASPIRAA